MLILWGPKHNSSNIPTDQQGKFQIQPCARAHFLNAPPDQKGGSDHHEIHNFLDDALQAGFGVPIPQKILCLDPAGQIVNRDRRHE